MKKPQVAEANAQLKASNAELDQARTNLARTEITLPFHGRVISTNVDVGQYVVPGTRLGRAFGHDVVEIRLSLNDSQLTSLGLPIGYIARDENQLPVLISAKVAGREQHWMGNLTRLDASIDPTTRMLFATAEVINPYGAGASEYGMPLAVGLYVKAEISGRELLDAYVIPRHALRAGNQVYVVTESGRLNIRDVEVTYSSAEEAVIGHGLLPNDKVVVSSIRNPIEGMTLEALPYALDSSAVARDSHKLLHNNEPPQLAGG